MDLADGIESIYCVFLGSIGVKQYDHRIFHYLK